MNMPIDAAGLSASAKAPGKPALLVIEDDEGLQRQLRWAYEDYEVLVASDRSAAIDIVRAAEPAVVTLDLGLPPDPNGTSEGFAALSTILGLRPETKVIVASGHNARESALRAIASGAYDFYQKPVDIDQLGLIVRRAFELSAIEAENRRLEQQVGESRTVLGSMITGAEEMQKVARTIERVANADVSVMLLGASGTGKELLANGLHKASHRRDGGFVAINCAAIPETLMESELFGHERGAFTGASVRRQGCFELASGGTLLLDEIAEMPALLQAKLLRVLEERTMRRLGGSQEVPVDVRVLAATNRDPMAAVRSGAFREDLLYRLNVITIHLPPLRARTEDLQPLVQYLITQLAERHDRPARRISTAALDVLRAHHWPGNVRELRNVIERAVVICSGESIERHHIALTLWTNARPRAAKTQSRSPSARPSKKSNAR